MELKLIIYTNSHVTKSTLLDDDRQTCIVDDLIGNDSRLNHDLYMYLM